MMENSKMIQSLVDESKSLKSKLANARTTLKILLINEVELKDSITDTLNENPQLQESYKQLLQEAEVWNEQVSELGNQKLTFEDSMAHG
jgi:chromosome segregation ATPase